MKRRQVLKRLLQASGGICATFLPGCVNHQHLHLLFSADLRQFERPLPDHRITPVGEFYVQSYASPPDVNLDTWQLQLTGLVEQPLTLKFADILAAPQTEFYLTMECIGNRTGGKQIGNALWTGTPLLPFLKQVRIQDKAVEFMLHAADSYETTLPIADLMRPDVQLVHRMNGKPLTKAHGFPLRIIIPGRYGQKQPKWLTEIEAIATPKKDIGNVRAGRILPKLPPMPSLSRSKRRKSGIKTTMSIYLVQERTDGREELPLRGWRLTRPSPWNGSELVRIMGRLGRKLKSTSPALPMNGPSGDISGSQLNQGRTSCWPRRGREQKRKKFRIKMAKMVVLES